MVLAPCTTSEPEQPPPSASTQERFVDTSNATIGQDYTAALRTYATADCEKLMLGLGTTNQSKRTRIVNVTQTGTTGTSSTAAEDETILRAHRRRCTGPTRTAGDSPAKAYCNNEVTTMAAGMDTNPGVGASKSLNAYWTIGPGRSQWASSPHPWTTLRDLLLKHMSKAQADGLASEYFHIVFGYWPGERKGDNPVGQG